MAHQLPDITTHFADWYNEVIYAAELADLAPVRGCIVIRPYGYAIWEHIVAILDKKIKDTGHQNTAFPLLIPLSFLQKEAQHVEGFAPEVAVVTHAGGKELEEPLVIRPTSETIIHAMFAQWIKSWRDLPMKINQWANVMRWETRTRPFLRTSEFWWQEGHTAHETAKEAEDEAQLMLAEYRDLIENYLAIPGVVGVKAESEKFAGADKTYTIEGLMPDGKALQLCTSHIISQSFARAFGMMYQDRNGGLSYPYLTSWGATTRLIGALIMVHGDQKGLILPPHVAPIQIVIIPIIKRGDAADEILRVARQLAQELRTPRRNLCCSMSETRIEQGVRVIVDDDETKTPGAKFYAWELKGVPLRIELGARDIARNSAVLVNRVTGEKESVLLDALIHEVPTRLYELQKSLLQRARQRRDALWYTRAKLVEFAHELEERGGFYQTGWCGRTECEQQIKAHKATIRCLLGQKTFSHCCWCDRESTEDILVAKAY